MMRKLLILLTLFLSGCSMGPTSYPGDKVETRACRWCNGSGQNTEPESEGGPPTGGSCPGCRGAKQLKVIVPGPKHPALVKGAVRDASKMPSGNDEVVALLEAREPLKPITGALGGAKITFEKDGARQEVSSLPSGRFKLMLEPGKYKVHLSADGFADSDQNFEVAVRQEPIWDEKAHLKTEAQEADTSFFDVALTPK
jgi:hypothetical protein